MSDQSTASCVTAKPYAQEAARRAVQEHLDRRGIAGTVVPTLGVYLQTKYALPSERPMVSIIIPTRDQAFISQEMCGQHLPENRLSHHTKLIVLDNESDDVETLEFLAELKNRDARARGADRRRIQLQPPE